MMDDEARVVEIAAAVADGAVVDWAAAESSAGSDADRARIRGLRLLANVNRLHTTAHFPPVPASPLHESILHPGRPSSELPDEAETQEAARWGPLEIVEKVGRGSFGDVYRAWDPRLDREVALKLLRRRDGADDVFGSSVIEEGRLQARVRHPGVITIYGADRIDGRVGLWMELIEGRTLEQELDANGPFEAAAATEIGIELCRALGAVHEEGLLHRDVKAQNVMRDEKGRLVLGDFGTGRATVDRDGPEEGPAHDVAGTPLYFAPEIFRREPATVQSDLYSLGVLLYHLVTGSFPVRGRSVRQLQDTHDLGSGRPLAEARPELPDPFVQIVDRALDPEAGRRYANAAEMEAAQVTWVSPPRDRARYWRVAASVAAALLIVIGAATWSGLLPLNQGPAPATGAQPLLEERDWVLVADFENATGEEAFDGAIDAAFERELRNSPFVNVVPRQRVSDALGLIQKPVETRLDAEVALEVARRDGEISAIVAGRLERFGPRYLLTASVRSHEGAIVAVRTEQAVDEDEVFSAMRRLSTWLRAEFNERGWVLVAEFENTTGEDFDGEASAARFERELSNSPFVNVVPRERVNDALGMMRKPVETRLDPEIAFQIALRDGEIRAIVGGRVERSGSRYLLTASVRNVDGSSTSSTEEAVDRDEVPSAMGRLSSWLRAELGEALASVEAGAERLQKVSTSSLRALQLYSQGYTL